VRQHTQKYSALSGSGGCKHSAQTGIRESRIRLAPQIRHSSGTSNQSNLAPISSRIGATRCGTTPAHQRLEKTHLLNTPVYIRRASLGECPSDHLAKRALPCVGPDVYFHG